MAEIITIHGEEVNMEEVSIAELFEMGYFDNEDGFTLDPEEELNFND